MTCLQNTNNTQIFTTDAYLQPMKITDKTGKEFWIWTGESFEEDSFKDGKICNPPETAESLEKLLVNTTEF
jgi:hypothetical protein